MKDNNFKTANQFFNILFNDEGSGIDNNRFTVDFYPFKEKSNGGVIRITVIIKINNKKIQKNFTVSKGLENNPSCILENKRGEYFNVPFLIMKNIYKFIQQLKNKFKNGESIYSIIKPNLTVLEFSKKYFLPNWKKKYPGEVSRHDMVMNYWGHYKIKIINSNDIESYILYISKTRSDSTIRKYCLILRKLFEIAIELGFRDRNPFINVVIPSGIPEKENFPIPSNLLPEIFFKLKNFDETLFKYCVSIYTTGIRPSKLLDLDLLKELKILDGLKIIEVAEMKVNKRTNRTGKKKITTIPVHPDLEKFVIKGRTSGKLLYYKNKSGARFIEWAGRKFKELFNNPEFTPYNFKHTLASELSNMNVNETHINFILGKLPEGTLKHYLKRNIEILNHDLNLLPSVTNLLLKYDLKKTEFSRFFPDSKKMEKRKEKPPLKLAKKSPA